MLMDKSAKYYCRSKENKPPSGGLFFQPTQQPPFKNRLIVS